MINRIIEFSVRQRGLVIVAGIVLAVWGVIAVSQTPIDAVPDLSENQVLVYTEWPGHGPQAIEDQITHPLSLQLQGIEGVRSVRAASEVDFSLLHLIFEDRVGFEAARARVQSRLASARDLPDGVSPRLAPEAIPTGQIFWYTVEGTGYDLAELRSIQDSFVRPQLEAVPGVAEVASVGGHVAEYHVRLDPQRLIESGLTLRDVQDTLARANRSVGGGVIHKDNAEYIVDAPGALAISPHPRGEGAVSSQLESLIISTRDGRSVRLGDVASVELGTRSRRGSFEKDGNEVTGGVVLIRFGHNPLEVTRRIKVKLRDIEPGLPTGVRVVSCYDRTPLIEGAVATVTGTLIEAILTATVAVMLVLLHWRTSFVIAVTLPLATLSSFVMMWLLRRLGIADIQTNIMSLAGIAISIGVLVDSSIVMAENVLHRLHDEFGDRPVRGDIRHIVLPACQMVGRPIFFSVLIMLVSFLPVFSLSGLDGKMFRPLAFTKTFALLAVAVLAITLVPALCTVLLKGRVPAESESWLVRSVRDVYRPVLEYLLDHPAALGWVMSVTFILGVTPLGMRWLLLAVVGVSLVVTTWLAASSFSAIAAFASLLLIALTAEQTMRPIGTENRFPLDEGMVMDMPITVPRASITQSTDDLKARDMVLCRFPEVAMVVGKAGRAETAFDPAPLDMIETMVEFRPRDLWPKRKLRRADAERHARDVLSALTNANHEWDELPTRSTQPLIEDLPAETQAGLLSDSVNAALFRHDAVLREFCHQRHQAFQRRLARELFQELVTRLLKDLSGTKPAAGDVAAIMQSMPNELNLRLATQPAESDVAEIQRRVRAASRDSHHHASREVDFAWLRSRHRTHWQAYLAELNHELLDRAPLTFTRLIAEELLARCSIIDERLVKVMQQSEQARVATPKIKDSASKSVPAEHHHGLVKYGPLPIVDPHPVFDPLLAALNKQLADRVMLWPCDREELTGFGGELDQALQMPGWTNVWTKPIQNRVDMLSTGVNSEVGVRILGRQLDDVVRASEEIAAVLRELPGAADVIADPVRGKGYLRIEPRLDRAAERGVSLADVQDLIGVALGGHVATEIVSGRQRQAVRISLARAWTEDETTLRDIPLRDGLRLGDVADIHVTEGPVSIRSENGFLRNYVRLNVRDHNAAEFVALARRVVAERVPLPNGVFVEWTGQYEHTLQATRTLLIVTPITLLVILLLLYLTYHDWLDALLMLLAVPGALVGGVLFQWLFGFKFSVAVSVGYIACFGMAAATGMIMLVYLRDAVDRAGGLNALSPAQLREAVLNGAVQRLRPKLLTEGTTILGLAPMLWATGTGAEVIRPMAAPVLGGILIADEMIDLFLPVLFYAARRWRQSRGASGSTAISEHPLMSAGEPTTPRFDEPTLTRGTV